jgi:hypothetical protein
MKKLQGMIRPTTSTAFNRDMWLEFIARRPELRSVRESRQVPNPFKPGELMTVHSNPDVADVAIDGCKVGYAHWSMSEEPLVVVSVDPVAEPLVLEWAKELGGEFRQEEWNEA